MPKLELFKFDGCPYCLRVTGLIEELGLKVHYQDIRQDPDALQRIIADTGRKTVPCLYIDGSPMFESTDIMTWLRDNSDKLEKGS